MTAKHSFDIDGVISIGIKPHDGDIIITGRSYEEAYETAEFLHYLGIHNQVFYSPVKYHEKSREASGLHKANIINALGVTRHFEDDPVQVEIIRRLCHNCYVVHVVSDLVNLENERKTDWRNEIE